MEKLTCTSQEHAWVTKGGQDPMMSTEENCADPVGMPNALEVNHAFTRKMSHLFSVVSDRIKMLSGVNLLIRLIR
jgi:[calcium/calmodulin-dependent protein kinase] kinase